MNNSLEEYLTKETVPKEGDLSVITNFYGQPLCIIEITKSDAQIEGEGDKSLRYWRNVHKEFFSKELQEYSLQFNKNMLVVFEEFTVVYTANM